MSSPSLQEVAMVAMSAGKRGTKRRRSEVPDTKYACDRRLPKLSTHDRSRDRLGGAKRLVPRKVSCARPIAAFSIIVLEIISRPNNYQHRVEGVGLRFIKVNFEFICNMARNSGLLTCKIEPTLTFLQRAQQRTL